ncbi:hypothetical protein SeLEV6574_g02258 [Synchytrium endobioticum]|uniref:Uncharacterized protein n=2 Tax=Synchytrium endobioticum TaxID=286115 RepID=A0A507D918_9FUNG|nr:hypothetical protein SeLEV6574_g02258 [Synchytrium endobioticum]
MLTSFIIIILVLWHQALPTIAEITDAEYSSYADSLREHRFGMTNSMKKKLLYELELLYSWWKDPNDSYGNEITSITGLLIDGIIPDSIPVKEETLWEPVEGNSQSHNEFVWEVLDTLYYFTYFWDYCEIENVHRQKLDDLRVWTLKHQEQLRVQIRLALGGSHDIFSDISPKNYDISALNAEVARVKEALTFGTFSMVSSLTQAELIYCRASDWCVGLGFGEMMRIDCSDEHGASISNARRANALAFSLLVVGRTLLLERSLSAFLEQRRKLPQPDWLIHELGKLERAVHKVQETRQEYQKRARRYMEKWKDALGEADRTYLRMDLLQEYFTLAASYIEISYLIAEELSSMQLRDIYDEAAAAASSSGGGGPSSKPFMNERIGVDSVAARDHGSSAGHFPGLSLDTSRTMSEHGRASSHKNRQLPDPGSGDMLE